MARRDAQTMPITSEQFCVLWESNWPPGKLAGLTGDNKELVAARARRLKLPARPREAVMERHKDISRSAATLQEIAAADLAAAGADICPKAQPLPADATVKILWDASVPIRAICIALGVSSQWVTARAAVSGWAPRDQVQIEASIKQMRIEKLTPFDVIDQLLSRHRAAAPPVPVKVAPARPKMAMPKSKPASPTPVFGAPGWSAKVDRQILDSKGAYSKIAKIARRLKIPSSRVLARFHQLRVMR